MDAKGRVDVNLDPGLVRRDQLSELQKTIESFLARTGA
jgi:hypothetical protein